MSQNLYGPALIGYLMTTVIPRKHLRRSEIIDLKFFLGDTMRG
jgi:hypothetical protein